MSHVPGITVSALLRSRPEAFGLTLELLAGAEGAERLITSPHVQKTGLALAGFHEYLKPGRVLIFGESEIRYLESLTDEARARSLNLALTHDFPCVLITGGFAPPAALLAEAERTGCPVLQTADRHADGDRQAELDSRGQPGRAVHPPRAGCWTCSVSAS